MTAEPLPSHKTDAEDVASVAIGCVGCILFGIPLLIAWWKLVVWMWVTW